jgi:hypothetical protein
LSKIDIKIHPELYRLLDDGETMEEFLRLPPDQILLRWFNYHLKAAGWPRRVENFSKDVLKNLFRSLVQVSRVERVPRALVRFELVQQDGVVPDPAPMVQLPLESGWMAPTSGELLQGCVRR